MNKRQIRIGITSKLSASIFPAIRDWIIISFIVLAITSCAQSTSGVGPKPTPKLDPKQSGYDLLNLQKPFSYVSRKMGAEYKEDIEAIKENLPELVRIATATDQLTVTPSYATAKDYLSRMMWSYIIIYSSMIENPTQEMPYLIPTAREAIAYFNLFVIEMNNLGHELEIG